jgi:hypothetical protein
MCSSVDNSAFWLLSYLNFLPYSPPSTHPPGTSQPLAPSQELLGLQEKSPQASMGKTGSPIPFLLPMLSISSLSTFSLWPQRKLDPPLGGSTFHLGSESFASYIFYPPAI